MRMLSSDLSAPDLSRECGGCTMCCTSLRIADLNKKRWTKCPYELRGSGCKIHESLRSPDDPMRPPACQEWACLWRAGFLDASWRPDRIGVFWQISGENNPFKRSFHIAHSDSQENIVRAMPYIKHLSTLYRVIVIGPNDQQLGYYGSPELMRIVNQVLAGEQPTDEPVDKENT